MHCLTTPPTNLSAALGEPVRWCLASDLDPTGNYGRSFLLLGPSAILSGDTAGARLRVPLADIKEFVLDELPGKVRLVARQADGDRVLISASPELAQELGGACRALEAARNGGEPVLPEVQPARDPATGEPLRERGMIRPKRSPFSTLGRLIGLLGPHRRRLSLLMALTFISVGAQLVPPLCFKAITDDVIGHGHVEALPWLITVMMLSFIAVSAARLFANRQNLFLSLTIVGEMRTRVHRKLQRLRIVYHQQHESGELIGRVSHDTGQLQHFLVDGMPWMLVNLVSLLVIGAMLFTLDPILALAVLVPVPVFVFGSVFFHNGMMEWWHRMSNRVSRMHSLLGESIRGVRAVKSAGQEERRAAEFDRINGQMVAANYGGERTWQLFMESATFAMAIGTVLVWAIGAWRVSTTGTSGGPSLGTLVAFVGYMAMFYGPLQWFAFVINWFAQAMTGAERIFQVLDQPEEGGAADSGEPFAAEPGRGVALRFDGVHFGYERGRAVLKGITVDIEPGTMVGLVGRSGSGKSTIINLLCRFYTPDAGRILVDGKDLSGLRLSDWRRQVGLVPQEPFLFNASIAENIRYAKPEADFAAVVAAAKAAHAHEFIMKKPDGYDTIVGEGGASLSGGEKQRIAIARAVLLDPPLLILDEATSAVDSETESKIQEALERLVRGRTTIAIAHRLATLRRSHRLVVIDEGHIVETGTHAELLAKTDGLFAKLAKTQVELMQVMSLSGDLAPVHDGVSVMGDGVAGDPLANLVRNGDRLAWKDGEKPRPVRLAWYRPLSARGSDLAVLDEKGKELARIDRPDDLANGAGRLVSEEVRLRYGDTKIERIAGIRFDQGNRFLDLVTDRGNRTVLVRQVERNFVWQADGSALICDIAGNRFRLPAMHQLDADSRRRLEEIL
ncbi:hypothetical protein LBMAG53_26150 [Planctomycetota bacterium]|nr:hypothetical protein LBMAG53_26150 [Planctomycetota bacterium]